MTKDVTHTVVNCINVGSQGSHLSFVLPEVGLIRHINVTPLVAIVVIESCLLLTFARPGALIEQSNQFALLYHYTIADDHKSTARSPRENSKP